MPERPLLSALNAPRQRALLVSAGAGVLLAVLIRINATLGTYIGAFEASFVIHVVGTLFALLLVGYRIDRAFWMEIKRGPYYELTGGLVGAVMVAVANLVVPILGTALAVSLFVVADLFFSTVTDAIGGLGLRRVRLSKQRVLGLVLALIGVLLIHWG